MIEFGIDKEWPILSKLHHDKRPCHYKYPPHQSNMCIPRYLSIAVLSAYLWRVLPTSLSHNQLLEQTAPAQRLEFAGQHLEAWSLRWWQWVGASPTSYWRNLRTLHQSRCPCWCGGLSALSQDNDGELWRYSATRTRSVRAASYLYLQLDVMLLHIWTEKARDEYTDKGYPTSQPFLSVLFPFQVQLLTFAMHALCANVYTNMFMTYVYTHACVQLLCSALFGM